ncbi:hypothetical protein ACVXG7_10170 [Enterobacter hormaechei]
MIILLCGSMSRACTFGWEYQEIIVCMRRKLVLAEKMAVQHEGTNHQVAIATFFYC